MPVPVSLLNWFFGINLVLFISFTCSIIWHVRYEFFVMKRAFSKFNVCLLVMCCLLMVGCGAPLFYPVESIMSSNLDGTWSDTPFDKDIFLSMISIRCFCLFTYMSIYAYIVYLRSSSIIASRPLFERKTLSIFVGLVLVLENCAWIFVFLQIVLGIPFPVLLRYNFVSLYSATILISIELFYLYHFIAYVRNAGGANKDKLLVIAYYGCYTSGLYLLGCIFAFATFVDRSNLCYLIGALENYITGQLTIFCFFKMTYDLDQLKNGKASSNSKPTKVSSSIGPKVLSSIKQDDSVGSAGI